MVGMALHTHLILILILILVRGATACINTQAMGNVFFNGGGRRDHSSCRRMADGASAMK